MTRIVNALEKTVTANLDVKDLSVVRFSSVPKGQGVRVEVRRSLKILFISNRDLKQQFYVLAHAKLQ